jgi:hypothetical protein
MEKDVWGTRGRGALGECVALADPSDRAASAMVDFRHDPKGARKSFPYEQLIWIDFEPHSTVDIVRLHFSTHTVTIHGHRLEALYDAFLRREVIAVTAKDERFVTGESEYPVVTRIAPQQSGPQQQPQLPHEFSDEPRP